VTHRRDLVLAAALSIIERIRTPAADLSRRRGLLVDAHR
jgi:hypothetical protein